MNHIHKAQGRCVLKPALLTRKLYNTIQYYLLVILSFTGIGQFYQNNIYEYNKEEGKRVFLFF